MHSNANAEVIKDVLVRVQNCGKSTWIGYESGDESLEKWMYVKVTFVRDDNQSISDCGGELPLAESLATNERGLAEGIVKYPSLPGHYRMRCQLHCFYIPAASSAAAPLDLPVNVL